MSERTWQWVTEQACPGWPLETREYVLWNCTAFPFVRARECWYMLRHAYRLALRAGFLPDSPDGGFR